MELTFLEITEYADSVGNCGKSVKLQVNCFSERRMTLRYNVESFSD